MKFYHIRKSYANKLSIGLLILISFSRSIETCILSNTCLRLGCIIFSTRDKLTITYDSMKKLRYVYLLRILLVYIYYQIIRWFNMRNVGQLIVGEEVKRMTKKSVKKEAKKGIGLGATSAIAWGVDTVLIGLIIASTRFKEAVLLAPIIAAFMHDFFSSIWISLLMIIKGEFINVLKLFKTKSGAILVLGALSGGPLAKPILAALSV